ncbi:hypothetical protein FGB62_25g715 [Gracilaria domingensis]|nr:hypothetical protein FGB62_25g715 [Gracilaria domingensis]
MFNRLPLPIPSNSSSLPDGIRHHHSVRTARVWHPGFADGAVHLQRRGGAVRTEPGKHSHVLGVPPAHVAVRHGGRVRDAEEDAQSRHHQLRGDHDHRRVRLGRGRRELLQRGLLSGVAEQRADGRLPRMHKARHAGHRVRRAGAAVLHRGARPALRGDAGADDGRTGARDGGVPHAARAVKLGVRREHRSDRERRVSGQLVDERVHACDEPADDVGGRAGEERGADDSGLLQLGLRADHDEHGGAARRARRADLLRVPQVRREQGRGPRRRGVRRRRRRRRRREARAAARGRQRRQRRQRPERRRGRGKVKRKRCDSQLVNVLVKSELLSFGFVRR